MRVACWQEDRLAARPSTRPARRPCTAALRHLSIAARAIQADRYQTGRVVLAFADGKYEGFGEQRIEFDGEKLTDDDGDTIEWRPQSADTKRRLLKQAFRDKTAVTYVLKGHPTEHFSHLVCDFKKDKVKLHEGPNSWYCLEDVLVVLLE